VASVRVAGTVAVWFVAAAAATAVGLTAVGLIGDDLVGGGEPLSQAEVDQRLAQTTSSAPPTTSATTTTTTPPPATPVPINTEAGVVFARCVPGGVQVISATPAQGWEYETDDDDGTVDDHPSVKFNGEDVELEVRLRCVDGQPQPEIERKPD
jgi:hypothetical protein